MSDSLWPHELQHARPPCPSPTPGVTQSQVPQSVVRVVSSAYQRLLIFLHAICIPACASSTPAFCLMYSAYKLNKQGDNIQPCTIPFLNLEPDCFSISGSNCCFLTFIQIFQEAVMVIWYSYIFTNFTRFFVIHTVKCFSIVNEGEVDAFLEFSCFFLWSSGCWQFNLCFLCLF